MITVLIVKFFHKLLKVVSLRNVYTSVCFIKNIFQKYIFIKKSLGNSYNPTHIVYMLDEEKRNCQNNNNNKEQGQWSFERPDNGHVQLLIPAGGGTLATKTPLSKFRMQDQTAATIQRTWSILIAPLGPTLPNPCLTPNGAHGPSFSKFPKHKIQTFRSCNPQPEYGFHGNL